MKQYKPVFTMIYHYYPYIKGWLVLGTHQEPAWQHIMVDRFGQVSSQELNRKGFMMLDDGG